MAPRPPGVPRRWGQSPPVWSPREKRAARWRRRGSVGPGAGPSAGSSPAGWLCALGRGGRAPRSGSGPGSCPPPAVAMSCSHFCSSASEEVPALTREPAGGFAGESRGVCGCGRGLGLGCGQGCGCRCGPPCHLACACSSTVLGLARGRSLLPSRSVCAKCVPGLSGVGRLSVSPGGCPESVQGPGHPRGCQSHGALRAPGRSPRRGAHGDPEMRAAALPASSALGPVTEAAIGEPMTPGTGLSAGQTRGLRDGDGPECRAPRVPGPMRRLQRGVQSWAQQGQRQAAQA